MKKTRVLQIVGSLGFAGIESVIMNYYRNIDREKYEFDFVVWYDVKNYEEEILSMGGRIFQVPQKNKHPLKFLKQLKKIMKEGNYDVCHCNSNSASAFLDLLAAKQSKIKRRVLHSHNDNCIIKWQHYILKPLLRFVETEKLACSEKAALWMFGSKRDVLILNNAIDLNKYQYDEQIRLKVRKEFNCEDKFIIGNVGSFQERKNQTYLLDVFAKLNTPNKELWLIGSGEKRDELVSKASSLGIMENVKFLGNRTDVNQLLQGMDVFAFPSLFEGVAVVLIEAQATGLPCVINETLSSQTDITNLVKRLSLENQELWVQEIDNLVNHVRTNTNQSVIDSGYDIVTEIKKLEEIYVR